MGLENGISVVVLLQSEEGKDSVKQEFIKIGRDFKSGLGRYDTKGKYHPEDPIFGPKIEPVNQAHKDAVTSLAQMIGFSEGSSRMIEGMKSLGVPPCCNVDFLFDESHIKRSQTLFD